MAEILDIQTVGNVLVINIDANPISGGGTSAPIGSIALTGDGSGTFTKTGALDTDWTLDTLINIPTPSIQVGGFNTMYNIQNLYSHYLPISGLDYFLNHNPKYYLFMAKSQVYHIKNGVRNIRNAGFYHPTHQNGINFPPNTSYYGGSTEIPLDSEFDIDTTPYTNTLIGFNPFQWSRFKNSIPELSFFGTSPSQWKIQGKKSGIKGHYKRSATFYLAIGIRNPNPISPYPILFGQPSQLFRLTFRINAGLVVGYNLTVQYSGVKRNY